MTVSELRELIKNYVARMVVYVITARGSASGQEDEILGRGDSDQSMPVRRLWPFGIRSVPPAGSEGIALAINGGRLGARVLVAAEHGDHGPKDLQSGECALYSAFDARVWLDKDGTIHILPKSGSARVKIGSSLDAELDPPVLRSELNAALKTITDAVTGHKHAAGTMTAGPTAVTGLTAPAVLVSVTVNGSSNVLVKK